MTNLVVSQTNDSSYYLSLDSKDFLTNYFHQTPFFRWCLSAEAQISYPLLGVIALIFRQCPEIKSCEAKFLANLTEEQKIHYHTAKREKPDAKVTYDVLSALGYTLASEEYKSKSPVEYMYLLQRNYRYKARGLHFNNRGKIKLEANTFAQYLVKRILLIQDEAGNTYHYNGKGLYNPIAKNMVKKLCRDVLNEAGRTLWNKRYETEYVAAFEHEIPYVSKFDNNPDIVNFQNGFFNIQTKEFSNHTPDYISLNQLPYEYDESAKCPKFEEFLMDIFEGDLERFELMRQIMGYLWLKEIMVQKAFILVGNGSNGKSVLGKVIRRLLGEQNVASTSLEDFEKRFGLQDLPGKLVNISSENEFTKEFTTEHLKKVTAGDSLTVERKYKDAFSTTLYVKMFLILNRLMDSDDITYAYFRRLTIIPLNKTYVELQQNEERIEGVSYMNPHLVEELGEELPGIFNFSMIGLHDLIENDYYLPKSEVCEEALKEYRSQQNPAIPFVENCIQYQPDSRILRSDISRRFQTWYRQNEMGSYRKLGRKPFLDALKQEFARKKWKVKEVKINGNIYLKNVAYTLNTTQNNDYIPPTN